MSKKVISIIALTLCLVMAVGLFAGCGKKDDKKPDTGTTDTQKTDTKAEKTKLEFWFYPRYASGAGQESGTYEKNLIDAYVKDNPNVSIDHEILAWNSGPEKVNIAISSNAMPDSVFDFPGRIIGYGIQGVLAELNNILTEEDKKDIPDAILDHCKHGDKIYMYPTHVSPVLMAVNKKLFRDAGVENYLPINKPNRIWTIDEFEKAMEGIKTLKNVEPIVIYAGNEQGDASIRMFIQNFGADFVNEDHTKVVINSEAGVKGLQWIIDAYKNGLIAPGAESLTSSDALDMFYQGRAATSILASVGAIKTVSKMIEENKAPKDFEFAFVPQPTIDGKDPKVEAQVIGYCIFDNKDQKRIEESGKFIEYLAKNKENVINTGALPVRESMGQLYDDPEVQFAGTMTAYLGDTGYTINNYAKVRALWYPQIQAALTGEKTAKEALDDFAKEATKVMNEK